MKKFMLSVLLVLIGAGANAEIYYLECEAIGYAYSYDTKQFYQSRKVGFRYKDTRGCALGSERTFIRNQWRSFFQSEVRESFKYTIDVKSDCECHDKPASGVSRDLQDFKSDFVRKGFYTYKLRGFDPEDRDF